MTAEIPRFMETLSLARVAYDLGREDHGNGRRVSREFEGSLPRRKRGIRIYVDHILKKGWKSQISLGGLSSAEKRLLIAAYDQGLLEKHLELEMA